MLVTKQELDSEINDLLFQIQHNSSQYKPIEIKAKRERIELLKLCRNYLLTQPTEELIYSQIEKINDRTAKIMQQFEPPEGDYVDMKFINQRKKAFMKEHNIFKLQEQLNTLKLLIKK